MLLVIAAGCSGSNSIADAFSKPTAKELYMREFKDNKPALERWESAYTAALNDSIEISLQYGEKGSFAAGAAVAYSYTLSLQEGEVLLAGVATDSVSQRVFVDVLERDGEAWRQVESNNEGAPSLAFAAQNTGSYKIIIQPELAADSGFFISLEKKPLYKMFPVAGKGNDAIGSFWGMERDGGQRSHEGIDIFAKKGTPVVAVTDGYITYTGESGLGGKQVWLRDNEFGGSLYYAHLDSIAVTSGTRAKAGDTLGFVGNTGNARFTPAHLHFGIYRGYGAVNPLPFVYQMEPLSPRDFTQSFSTQTLTVKGAVANLRQGPSTVAGKIGELKANDLVTCLGENKEWLHVQTAAGQKAFLHKSLVKEAN